MRKRFSSGSVTFLLSALGFTMTAALASFAPLVPHAAAAASTTVTSVHASSGIANVPPTSMPGVQLQGGAIPNSIYWDPCLTITTTLTAIDTNEATLKGAVTNVCGTAVHKGIVTIVTQTDCLGVSSIANGTTANLFDPWNNQTTQKFTWTAWGKCVECNQNGQIIDYPPFTLYTNGSVVGTITTTHHAYNTVNSNKSVILPNENPAWSTPC